MATQGPLFPGTVTTQSVSPESANDWLTPNNIKIDDAAEAQITAATYDSPDISFRLKAQNLGFTIPADSIIHGITVEIDRRAFAGTAADFRVQLLDAAGALVGTNKASASAWPATLAIATYGGAADTWAASPTAAMLNDIDFGVVLSVSATAANTDIGVDFIRVTITYTPPVEIQGDVSGLGSSNGAVANLGGLVGAVSSLGVVIGSLGNIAVLAGAVTGLGTPSGILILVMELTGESFGQGTIIGRADAIRMLIGAVFGNGVAVGAFPEDSLQGVVVGAGSASGTLISVRAVEGSTLGTAAAQGTLEQLVSLIGQVTGVGITAGEAQRIVGLIGALFGGGFSVGDLENIQAFVLYSPPCPTAVLLDPSVVDILLSASGADCTPDISETDVILIC